MVGFIKSQFNLRIIKEDIEPKSKIRYTPPLDTLLQPTLPETESFTVHILRRDVRYR